MKILIVDDNRDFCSTLADVVRTQGWEAEVRNSPEAALAFLNTHNRDVGLMLLDIEFGSESKMTGIDVLSQSVRSYPSIPIIMISGKGTIETAVKATKLGALKMTIDNRIESAKKTGRKNNAQKQYEYDAPRLAFDRLYEFVRERQKGGR